MKKKILATLLAVCLFVGMAIPAVFAASSDVAGDAKKVSKIVIEKNAYDIEAGKSKNFADQITVYENDTKLVLDHGHIQYSILANTGDVADFTISGSTVTANKVGATATLTVYDNYSKSARVSVKLTAVAASAAVANYAESYTFAKNLTVLPITEGLSAAETQEIIVEAHPKGSSLTAASAAGKDGMTSLALLLADFNAKFGTTATVAIVPDTDDSKAKIVIPAANLATCPAALAIDKSIAYELKAIAGLNKNSGTFSVSTNLRAVRAVRATGISIPSETVVKVGQKVEPTVTFYPTNANVGKALDRVINPYIQDGNGYEYATLDGDKVLGVNSNAPGKARLAITLTAMASTTESIITVKPASFVGQITPTLPAAATVEVGKTVGLIINNLPANVTVVWTTDTAAVATVKAGVVTGVKVGTAKVTATLSTGEILVSTVTVKAAAVVKPTTPTKPTTNPQTGDSFFANLFN